MGSLTVTPRAERRERAAVRSPDVRSPRPARKAPSAQRRSRRSFQVITRALRAGGDRFEVGVVQFSVQRNHIHLLVEAASRTSLARALKGLGVRIAKGLNRMMGKSGRVLGDRYHAHLLRTPTEVRHAMTYIRDSAKKHAAVRGAVYSAGYVDPYSSAAAQDVVLPVARTWLLREGWRRGVSAPRRGSTCRATPSPRG